MGKGRKPLTRIWEALGRIEKELRTCVRVDVDAPPETHDAAIRECAHEMVEQILKYGVLERHSAVPHSPNHPGTYIQHTLTLDVLVREEGGHG